MRAVRTPLFCSSSPASFVAASAVCSTSAPQMPSAPIRKCSQNAIMEPRYSPLLSTARTARRRGGRRFVLLLLLLLPLEICFTPNQQPRTGPNLGSIGPRLCAALPSSFLSLRDWRREAAGEEAAAVAESPPSSSAGDAAEEEARASLRLAEEYELLLRLYREDLQEKMRLKDQKEIDAVARTHAKSFASLRTQVKKKLMQSPLTPAPMAPAEGRAATTREH
eukprot:GHVT01101495.1.p1 GENE.GHVT01101495.1~~GHVT01101495.1.p1  ORF type:complete len:222 (+),score=63.60 GHVT01101495.1:297-962(+)